MNSNTILNKSEESGQLCFIPTCRGNAFSFSLFIIKFAIGLSYNFYYTETCSQFLQSFYNQEMLIFVSFVKFLFLGLVMCSIPFIGLHVLNYPSILKVKPIGSVFYNLYPLPTHCQFSFISKFSCNILWSYFLLSQLFPDPSHLHTQPTPCFLLSFKNNPLKAKDKNQKKQTK